VKKYLPLILLVLGILVLVLVYFFVIRKPAEKETAGEDQGLTEVILKDRPITSLTPSSDGHWLKLKIEKIKVSAKTLDYELLYQLPDGRTQGVPGTVKLTGENSFTRDLLLGSESSGKFRYDEGVEEGTLTLRFRNDKGKLITKFSTKFHLQSNTKEISSIDGKLKATLNKLSKAFFVTMETFGVPGSVESASGGPYGIFSSATEKLTGEVKLSNASPKTWNGSTWVEDSSIIPGIYILQ
jgi:hypothetical protein